jgi:putative ABC transport system permease protein
VLKTLGFSDGLILALVLGESIFIALLGGSLGLLLAWVLVQQGDPTGGLLPAFLLPGRDLLTGVWLMLALGLLAGAIPAAQAMRLKITDALRRN